ncbi:hypothetical protein FJT64_025404 [Amphibalanus amphitrite]|uniref:Uncharacterized protein n=1 Tax=Amphibalanus amphitrite TaxID=1232801 RepID=A0A6A4W7Q0_AMPAM|nr:hypothetical protein FJT64_025404 [Amphibalanus amphitrite]
MKNRGRQDEGGTVEWGWWLVKMQRAPEIITVRSTRRVDEDALCLSLLQADWSELDAAQSITDKWDRFLAVWDPIMNHYMPLKTIKLKHRPSPWMEDEAVKEAMAARDLARADRDCTPCEETREEYRVRRNAVKMAINRACSSFYETSFRNSRSKTWKDIRRFLVSSSNRLGPTFTGRAPVPPPFVPGAKLEQFLAPELVISTTIVRWQE